MCTIASSLNLVAIRVIVFFCQIDLSSVRICFDAFTRFVNTLSLDPFARVIFLNQSQATEKEEKTLCPTWDQTLIFESVDIHGDPRYLIENPPQIIVEVFDHDAFVSIFFLKWFFCPKKYDQ